MSCNVALPLSWIPPSDSMCNTISLIIWFDWKSLCWNPIKFLAYCIMLTTIANAQLVISAISRLLFANLQAHATSIFQSWICLWCPSKAHSRLYGFLVIRHSKKMCVNDSILYPQNTQSEGISMPNFCSLSTTTNLLCTTNHNINLSWMYLWM